MRSAEGPEGNLFRNLVDRQGHFKGAYDPNKAHEINKQGVYCFTPSGIYLGSIYSNEPEEVANALNKAWQKWQSLTPIQRLGKRQLDPSLATARAEQGYPNDGLVLFETMRDLPRTPPQDEFYAGSWNRDFVWFTKEETLKFLPLQLIPGARQEVPQEIIRRFSRAHLLDNVRSLDFPYEDCDVQQARLITTIVGIDRDNVHMRLDGAALNSKSGVWAINGAEDHDKPTQQTRGVRVNMLGWATYNLSTEAFTKFELVALGTRWGSTQWNGRTDDLKGGPIGFAFTLANREKSSDRMAPYALTWGMYW